MKVTLIDYTGKGQPDPAHYAAALLAFTKSTRLTMSPGGLDLFLTKSDEELNAELAYMANTVPSSHEFVDYTFLVEGVSRAFTHQFVRSRTWSFAQQAMRVLNVGEGAGWDYYEGPTIGRTGEAHDRYHQVMFDIDSAYKGIIAAGAKVEDARGVLPTNILTNIVGKSNMRNFIDLARKRSGPRVQGEYREVLEAMKGAVRAVHPFIDIFINRSFDAAARDLDKEIEALSDAEQAMRMAKLVDLMRGQS